MRCAQKWNTRAKERRKKIIIKSDSTWIFGIEQNPHNNHSPSRSPSPSLYLFINNNTFTIVRKVNQFIGWDLKPMLNARRSLIWTNEKYNSIKVRFVVVAFLRWIAMFSFYENIFNNPNSSIIVRCGLFMYFVSRLQTTHKERHVSLQ